MKPSPFSHDHEAVPAPLGGEAITQGGSVIVGTKDEFPFVLRSRCFAQTNYGFGAVIYDVSSLAGELRVCLSMGTSIGSLELAGSTERGPISQDDSEPGRSDDLLVAEQDTIVGNRVRLTGSWEAELSITGSSESEFDSYAAIRGRYSQGRDSRQWWSGQKGERDGEESAASHGSNLWIAWDKGLSPALSLHQARIAGQFDAFLGGCRAATGVVRWPYPN